MLLGASTTNQARQGAASALPAVAAVNAGKCYHLYTHAKDRLKQLVLGNARRFYREVWALRGVNLVVPRGRTVGLVGANGSGKSTLLQMIAGTVTPSEGRVDVRGRVAALLELGSGFNPEFTGRDNVYLNAGILGLSREEINERFDDVAAFADIGSFLDCPVRTYSSGMMVRLAFSVAICVDPDVLLVDEALAVGDFRFQQRCLARIRQLRDRGVTILFVTHDLDAAKRLCDELHVLDAGRLVHSGPSASAANWYLSHLASSSAKPSSAEQGETALAASAEEFGRFRHGSGGGRINSVEWLATDGRLPRQLTMDETYTLRVEIAFSEPCPTPILGFYLRDRLGTDLIGINTDQEGAALPPAKPGDVITVDFRLPLRLRPGRYGISCGLAASPHELHYLDWIDNALVFDLADPRPGRVVFGLTHPEVHVEIASTPAVSGEAAAGPARV